MVQNSKKALLLLPISLSFFIAACVPVVIVAVGGAAGKSVISDKPPVAAQPQDLLVSEPIIHEPLALSQDGNEHLDIGQSSSSQNLPPAREKSPEQVAILAPIKPPALENNVYVIQAHQLLKSGWKIKINEIEKNNMSEIILYFDTDNNYYGFDGCKYFKGKFVLDGGNQIYLKTLLVSSKGSDDCGNKIEINLFMANSFVLLGNDLLLRNNDKLLLTFTYIDNFNANTFLTNVRLNTAKKSPKSKSKTRKNGH
jgi:hypothetical protein